MTVVPLANLSTAPPEQGRIRIGVREYYVKDGQRKNRPSKINTFRFTSHDEAAIRQIADFYGGDVEPWTENAPTPGQWQVVTQRDRIPILLPPEPLGAGDLVTPVYELWSAAGLLRRCSGTVAQITTADGKQEAPCICERKGTLECKLKVRLSVILRDVRFGGTWRIETGGWTAARELPGMTKAILALQARGMPEGELILREEKSVVQTAKGPQTRRYMVPMLTTSVSVAEMVAGVGAAPSLGPPPQAPQLPAPAADIPAPPPAEVLAPEVYLEPTDEEIAEAELVEPDEHKVTATHIEFYRVVDDMHGLPELAVTSRDELRHALCRLISHERTSSSKDLTSDELRKAIALGGDVLAGDRRAQYIGQGLLVSRRRDA